MVQLRHITVGQPAACPPLAMTNMRLQVLSLSNLFITYYIRTDLVIISFATFSLLSQLIMNLFYWSDNFFLFPKNMKVYTVF